MSISENLAYIRERIDAALQRSGRKSDAVKLIAVSKTKPVTMIQEAYHNGQRIFGENYVQEFSEKYSTANLPDAEWHLIGHLQSNKVKLVLGKASLIHTVDKVSLAEEISKRAAKENMAQEILLEVNISGEASKYGLPPSSLFSEAEKIFALPNLAVKGLMTIASPDTGKVRAEFQAMATLLEKLKTLSPSPLLVSELSMGMSQDFEIAIEEGATLIRIGTAIFGER
jgi:PLP dependent protein